MELLSSTASGRCLTFAGGVCDYSSDSFKRLSLATFLVLSAVGEQHSLLKRLGV